MRSTFTRVVQAAIPVAFVLAVVAGWAAIVYGIWRLVDGYKDGWAFTIGGVFGLLLLISATTTDGALGSRPDDR
ncbi:hypothetical protein [Nocardia stercoris]|uniref:Uncharacterized protein n=1 Tax=Nocardia stercoris TaxID=2483361 RepID=A0A3M2KZ69_9NOCA|nr:hypothetical protein [Nocardia stercoris]RMI30581.1 hypothetical protein EBN03_21160 [Nocardia stercoris]